MYRNSSKKELIGLYEKGVLKEVAAAHISNVAGVVLIEANDEIVFGYVQVMDGEKDYFKRKVEYTRGGAAYFMLGSIRHNLENFMRI